MGVFLVLLLGWTMPTFSVVAGGSGLNVMVVANPASTNSLQLANLYSELRSVPPQNFVRMQPWTGGRVSWTRAEFESHLLEPLRDALTERGLLEQAQVVLLSMDIPYRVTDGEHQNSTTSLLFYGFKQDTEPPVPGFPASCSLPDAARYEQALGELPFAEARPAGDGLGLWAMMLTDTSLAAAERTLRRAVVADGSFPTNRILLERTSDTARNVRYPAFDDAIFEASVLGWPNVGRVDSNATDFTFLGGFQTGLYSFTVPTNALVPGAIADTMTSFAGGIFENQGQTTLLEFLKGGAVGSYGTIVEPCNYPEKFPDPKVFFYLGRGFSLGEAYYASVRHPYQGHFVGEPLSAPFSRRPTGGWTLPPAGATLSGQVLLECEFGAGAAELPVASVQLFVDGRYVQTLTNLLPSPGNLLTGVIGGSQFEYSVPALATLSQVAGDLAGALNQQLNGVVQVEAVGDRLRLKQLASEPEMVLSASAGQGMAETLTTTLSAARPGFLPSPAMGVREFEITNAPAVGDWVGLSVVKTNGSLVFLAVTNLDAQATAETFARSLTNRINSHPDLQLPDGLRAVGLNVPYGSTRAVFELYANRAGRPAAAIRAAFQTGGSVTLLPAGTNDLTLNLNDLYPRNHLYLAAGVPLIRGAFPFDTAAYPDGEHELTLVAADGSSIQSQRRVARKFTFANHGLSATLVPSIHVSAVPLETPWSIRVSANEPDIASIDLYSTGGLLASSNGTPAAVFPIPSVQLGLGLHPFYAVVRNSLGQQYRTATLLVRLTPTLTLTLAGPPWRLTWPAAPGVRYEIQSTPSLAQTFQPIGTMTATNTMGLWPLPDIVAPAFYRLRVAGD